MISLPRQARDKHTYGKHSKIERYAFFAGVGEFDYPALIVLSQRKQVMARMVGAFEKRCETRHLFLSFPYVCPEPVLAK
jgi:hypothetical protein